jgi:uncharacterized LabA/DUF88 family protein
MSRYTFIDGEALLQFMADAAQRISPDEEFSVNYKNMRSAFGGQRAFFYDAHPARRSSEDEEEFRRRRSDKDSLLKVLSRLDGMHIRTGMSRYRRKRGLEQKGVDIQLAIEAYQHAVRGNIEEAVLITNDLDFYPLLDALTQTRVRTILRYVPGKTSELLIEAADFAAPLLLFEFAQWCDPPYSRHSELSMISRPFDPLPPVFRCGRLDGREFVIYRIEQHDQFLIDHQPMDHLVLCKNLVVGIDWLESKTGDTAKFDIAGAPITSKVIQPLSQ